MEAEDLHKHKMNAEYYNIDEAACQVVNKAKEEGRSICAIGTTTIRALESSYTSKRFLKPGEGWTNNFIFPPYEFCAFGGYELIMEAYKKAVKEEYQFSTYGDAMLVI